jgi:acyl-CoA reductase-like NAD-dependent aldehyde dehydrogenase
LTESGVQPHPAGFLRRGNPATGEVLGLVAPCDTVDVDRTVAAARRAFDEGAWSRAVPEERKSVLSRLADVPEGDLAMAIVVNRYRRWSAEIEISAIPDIGFDDPPAGDQFASGGALM